MYHYADLTDPINAHSTLMERYIEQLFGHLDQEKMEKIRGMIANRVYGLHIWVLATRKSYDLWLTYAMIELPHDTRRTPTEVRPTGITAEQKRCVDTATQEELEAYHGWAFELGVIPRPPTPGFYRDLVSPTHFWFYKNCCLQEPRRSIFPVSTGDFFRHPIFSIAYRYQGLRPLVVPEYFLSDTSTFDGWGEIAECSFYVFPNFAQRLFDYVEGPLASGADHRGFVDYYSGCETAWFVPSPSGEEAFIVPPHPLLKRNWRWEDVLAMLHSTRVPGEGGGKSRAWKRAPINYKADRLIVDYFGTYARMAGIWKAKHQ